MQARLVGSGGVDAQVDRSEVLLGRGEDCDVALSADDGEISRHHARLRFNDGGFTLEDAGSGNGTFVNDERVSAPRPLQTGDVIRCGSTRLVFLAEPNAPDPRPEAPPPAAARAETVVVPAPAPQPRVELPSREQTVVLPPSPAPAAAPPGPAASAPGPPVHPLAAAAPPPPPGVAPSAPRPAVDSAPAGGAAPRPSPAAPQPGVRPSAPVTPPPQPSRVGSRRPPAAIPFDCRWLSLAALGLMAFSLILPAVRTPSLFGLSAYYSYASFMLEVYRNLQHLEFGNPFQVLLLHLPLLAVAALGASAAPPLKEAMALVGGALGLIAIGCLMDLLVVDLGAGLSLDLVNLIGPGVFLFGLASVVALLAGAIGLVVRQTHPGRGNR